MNRRVIVVSRRFRWPVAASDVARSRTLVNRFVGTHPYVGFGDPGHCCTHLLPDSPAAAAALRRAHRAFAPASAAAAAAARVLDAFREGDDVDEACVAHWRDEDDFVTSEHALDRAAYRAAMIRALDPCRAALLVGDVSRARLGELRGIPGLPTLYAKTSLLPGVDWAAAFGGEDLASMVDSRVAEAADRFVGSPFSSFSALVAFARGPERTAMADVDVADSLGALFEAQFPADAAAVGDPCASLVSASEKFAKRLVRHTCAVGAERAPLAADELFDLREKKTKRNVDGGRSEASPCGPDFAGLSTAYGVTVAAAAAAAAGRGRRRVAAIACLAFLPLLLRRPPPRCRAPPRAWSRGDPWPPSPPPLAWPLARSHPCAAGAAVAVISANLGAGDVVGSAPRQRGCAPAFLLFVAERTRAAGWTTVLPAAGAATPAAIVGRDATAYSRTWAAALRTARGASRGGGPATGAYRGEDAPLPFDLASLGHTARTALAPEHAKAQSLPDVMAAKFVKLQFLRFDVLKRFDVFLWADAALAFDASVVARALRPFGENPRAALALEPHPQRNSSAEELAHCLEAKAPPRLRALRARLEAQRAAYGRVAGWSDDRGLYWAAFFAARRRPAASALFDAWWLEVRRWQYRDQISLPFALAAADPPLATFRAFGEAPPRPLPREQALCATLVGDVTRCCRRCAPDVTAKLAARAARLEAASK